MTLFLTADTHFGHAGVVDHVGRPFADVAAMDSAMVEIWNMVVGPKDTVWHLGDFSLGPRGTAERIFRRLNGSIHLVRGNHDGDDVRSCGWASVHDMHSFRIDGTKVVLCHYPMLSWPGSAHNRDGRVASIMAHGHVNGSPGNPRVPHLDPCRQDVGVDMRAYAPIAAETLIEEVRKAVEESKATTG